MQIRWFPPSWVQLRIDKSILYIDPAYMRSHFINHPGHIEYNTGPDVTDGLPDTLEPADAILVTHHHKDHASKVTIGHLCRTGTRVIGPKTCLAELGAEMQVVKVGEEIQLGEFLIKVVPAYNTPQGSSTRKIHHEKQGVGYLVTGGGGTVYHAGDSDFIPEMGDLGGVDVAFLPIGGTYTMDLDEAVQAALAIKPRVVIPMHHLEADPLAFKHRLEALTDEIRVECLESGGDVPA